MTSARGIRWCLAALCAVAAVVVGASEPLPRVAPEDLGIDPVGVDRFLVEFGRVPGAHAVVVAYRGQIIAERYLTGSASTLRHVRSVTKSVSSTLIGVAVERGFIAGIDLRMVDYLPTSLSPADPSASGIRLHHLLTHTSGLQWEENREFSTWESSTNPLRFILNRPLVSDPGTAFNYSTPATHVLSAILEEATGIGVEDFAASYLFSPLGISSWRWQVDRQGYPFGGHGLELRTDDMTKLGIVFLDRGRWGDREIVSPEWVDSATAVQYRGSSDWGPVQNVSYGYLWWLASAGGTDIFMAIGWGGQFVICVPILDLVVATNSRWQVDATTADAQERAVLGVVVDHALPLFPVLHHPPRRPSHRVRPLTGSSAGKTILGSGKSRTVEGRARPAE